MRKFILAIILSVMSIYAVAQSGWQAGNYYMYKGQTTEQCGNSYPKYDSWGNFYGYYQTCRILRWEQRQQGGYIYVWNNGYWTTQWYNGWAWYCYWGPWYEKRVY